MPRFTIGIPTYNRAPLLRRAIESALAQTYPDVEVVVSDNASTDDTEVVARLFEGRVRYHRNPENVGSWGNFARLTELATGEYFAWLQDDDLLHRDFTRRAAGALGDQGVVAYAGYAVHASSPTAFVHPFLCGPPVEVNWMTSEPRVVSGLAAAALSFFVTFSMPPSLALRTDVARRAVRHARPDCTLFNERIVLVHAVLGGLISVDPWVAGVWTRHPDQEFRVLSRDAGRSAREWLIMADEVGRLLAGVEKTRLEEALRSSANEIPIEGRENMLRTTLHQLRPATIHEAHPIAREAYALLLGSIPPNSREADEIRRLEEAPRVVGAVSVVTRVGQTVLQLAARLDRLIVRLSRNRRSGSPS